MESEKQKSGADLLTGLLKDVKHKSSVEEQHEIVKLWARAAARDTVDKVTLLSTNLEQASLKGSPIILLIIFC